jgi:putative Mg2+ transporter-C (MgtC) family protein
MGSSMSRVTIDAGDPCRRTRLVLDPAAILDIAARLLLAMALGAVIGLERQWRLRNAGIRTNALVSVGSALFVIVGAVGLGERDMVDPTRVAAQVVSGIGFLGAGVILRDGFNIRGLTTAATLWCAAAVGSLAGAGMTLVAIIGAATIVVANTFLRPVSRFVSRHSGGDGGGAAPRDAKPSPVDYTFEAVTTEKNELRVRALVLQSIDRPELILRSLDVRPGKASRMKVVAGISSDGATTTGLEAAVQRISLDPKVVSIRWWVSEVED